MPQGEHFFKYRKRQGLPAFFLQNYPPGGGGGGGVGGFGVPAVSPPVSKSSVVDDDTSVRLQLP